MCTCVWQIKKCYHTMKSSGVACPHVQWPHIACSFWMRIHSLACFGFFHHQIVTSHPCCVQCLSAVSSAAWFYLLHEMSPGLRNWVTYLPEKRGALSSHPTWTVSLVTPPKQMPSLALAQTTQETLSEPHVGELRRRPSWTLTVGTLFSNVGNETHTNTSTQCWKHIRWCFPHISTHE